MTEHATSTVGGYLAARLRDTGLRHFFTVPGHYNLVLLDELLKSSELDYVGCCNELNAGYPADGFAYVTADAVMVRHPTEAPGQIDRAIATALREHEPVHIEVACNVASAATSQRTTAVPRDSDEWKL